LPTWFALRMRMALLSVLLFLIAGATHGQSLWVITENSTKEPVLPHAKMVKVDSLITPQQAIDAFASGAGETVDGPVLGYIDQYVWLYTTVTYRGKKNAEFYLELNNPHMDYLEVFEVRGAEIVSHGKTGDIFTFRQRPLAHRNFVFPLPFSPGEEKQLLMVFYKPGSSIEIPLHLWAPSAMSHRDYVNNLGYGAFFGFLLICFLASAGAYVVLKRVLHLWYALYVLSVFLYVLANLGLAFQWLYPQTTDVNSIIHVSLSVTIFVFFFKFSQSFLPFQQTLPRVNAVLSGITYYFLISILIGVATYPAVKKISVYWLPVNYVIMLVGHVLVVGGAVYVVRKHRQDAALYLVAICVLFFFGSLQVLRAFDVAVITSTDLNLLMVGTTFELLILSLALTLQMKKVYDERNALSVKMAQQQKELLKAYVEGVEKERERVSRELHDDIGSRLSTLKRHAGEGNVLHEKIDELCTDVRNMSHQLSPATLKVAGLRHLVTEMAEETGSTTGIAVDVQFYDWPADIPEEVAHHLYRVVQEAVSNTVKYAQATELDIQFFKHQNELVITIDDNGKGFELTDAHKGIGLKNMQARVASLQGTLEISSDPTHGTSILIKGIYV